jgi:hypothetical protein
MNDYPAIADPIWMSEYQIIITMPEQEPRSFNIKARCHYDAFVAGLREIFGDERDQVMPPFIFSCKRITP